LYSRAGLSSGWRRRTTRTFVGVLEQLLYGVCDGVPVLEQPALEVLLELTG
jgi:hypothetical protein